jgi:hypothetical protein
VDEIAQVLFTIADQLVAAKRQKPAKMRLQTAVKDSREIGGTAN